MRKIAGVLTGLVLCGCVQPEEKKPEAVRLRFVPTATGGTDRPCGSGASWSALHPFPEQTGLLLAQAHAGIGDTFPVQEQGGHALFEVLVVEGDDDHLVLEIRTKDAPQRIDVRRDVRASVKVAGHDYELLYPSVTVRSADSPTTSKALLLVTCRR